MPLDLMSVSTGFLACSIIAINLGTLATAAATTGVEGLEAIVSEAAISSWYDYYRENGLVMAPHGFQGEDADVLAAETFSRTKNLADYQNIRDYFDNYLATLQTSMDLAPTATGSIINGFLYWLANWPTRLICATCGVVKAPKFRATAELIATTFAHAKKSTPAFFACPTASAG